MSRRRSSGEILTAIGAIALLALLVLGVPLALASFVGWPLPDKIPSLDTLRQPLSVSLLIDVLSVLLWLAWAQFTACVLVEAKAAISGVGMPARVPGAGPSQALARQLVAAVLLISAGAASLTPALSAIAPNASPAPRPAAVAVRHHANLDAASIAETAATAIAEQRAETATAAAASQETKFYRVQPPAGRHHDSLWDLAERHLGEGRRYGEIYHLNKGRQQPDGSTLTKASLIRPGWVLEMPGDAFGGDLVEQADLPVAARDYPEPVAPAPVAQAPVSQAPVSQAPVSQALVGEVGVPVEHGAPAPVAGKPAPVVVHEVPSSGGSAFRLPTELALAPLLAAGLLIALRRQRRLQIWHRAAGRRITTPDPDAAVAEEAVRLGAGEFEVRFLDHALRGLAAASQALPPIYGARLTADGLDLLIAGRTQAVPPEPWAASADGRVWHLPRHAVRPVAQRAVAPYPGLVSVGTAGNDRVLIDLEAAPGVIAVGGDPDQRRAVLAAMAAELATNTWSDRMRITLVGFADDLTVLAPERVRHAESLDAVLPELEAEFAERTRLLTASGLDSVLTGRLSGAHATKWTPHFVIVADEPSGLAAARLTALGAAAGRVGVGYLVAGDVPGSAWRFQVAADGALKAPLLGIDVAAQRLPASQYAAVLRLFAAASDLDGIPTGADPAPSAQVEPLVRVRMLGELDVQGAGELEPERLPLCEEALVYLTLHRDGVHPAVLAAALWPRGVTAHVSDAVLARLVTWLGNDPSGRPNLAASPSGHLVLGPYVQSDWETFLSLRESDSPQRLAQALDLVRGTYLAGHDSQRFGWLAHETAEAMVPAAIADTALELSELRMAADDPHGAIDAVVAGMRGSPVDEELWRQLLRATHATGDVARLENAVGELYRRTSVYHGVHGLHPKTRALVDELLPSWRLLVAN